MSRYLEIQGFPQNYKIAGTLLDQYTQIEMRFHKITYALGVAIRKTLENKEFY